MGRKNKYGAGGDGRKQTVMKKAEELCTLSSFQVFAGVIDNTGSKTIWPPEDHEEIIGSYRLRRDIQSYQISKEPKRKMPRPKLDQGSFGGSIVFPPPNPGLLSSCVDELVQKINVVDQVIMSCQKMPSPGPAVMDHTEEYTSDYLAALDAYAYEHGMDASEAHPEFDYVTGWCFPPAVDNCTDESELYLLFGDGMGWDGSSSIDLF